jgi:hypothetical protein
MRAFLFAPILLCVACAGGAVVEAGGSVPPADTARGTGDVGTVRRGAITVRVTIDPADASLASTLGIGAANLTVRLLREATPSTSATTVTDSLGTGRFENLLEGRYSLTVERALTEAERSRLPPDALDATVLAGGTSLILTPPSNASATVSLVGARRGSLVMSEQYGYTGTPTPYNWGMYMEFYNNGDTTVYMDGMLLVRRSLRLTRPDSWAPCDDPTYIRYRRDTTRVWVESGIRFPGTGRDFPVRPGQTRLYA